MATRTIYVGDTYPPMRFSLSSGNPPQLIQNLAGANSITVTFESKSNTFSGPGTPLVPPQTDQPEGTQSTGADSFVVSVGCERSYNLAYYFGANDTQTVGVYAVYVVVEWPQGQQTFSTTDTLTILAMTA